MGVIHPLLPTTLFLPAAAPGTEKVAVFRLGRQTSAGARLTQEFASAMSHLLAYPFRPFFLAAGSYAIGIVLAWVGFLFIGWPLPVGWAPLQWHSHEMIYGFGQRRHRRLFTHGYVQLDWRAAAAGQALARADSALAGRPCRLLVCRLAAGLGGGGCRSGVYTSRCGLRRAGALALRQQAQSDSGRGSARRWGRATA